MPRFFFDKTMLCDYTVTLTGEDAAHIATSLRMAIGEDVVLCDGEGFDYLGKLSAVSREAVTVTVEEILPSRSEPPFRIRVYQCLPKGDKLETVIQKSVECGAVEIIPVQSLRCIVKWKGEDERKKLSRYNRIAEEAAKQSGRGIIPCVKEPMSIKDAIRAMTEDALSFLCYENEDGKTLSMLLRSQEKPRSVSFLVGPEGGLAPEEVAFAAENGVLPISLGARILRTETASPVVLAILSAFYEL